MIMEDMFARLLVRSCPTELVRAVESNPNDPRVGALWGELEDSGFTNALLVEENGGFGLSLAELLPVISLIGEHVLPLPLGETMVARAILSRAGIEPPLEPIVLATSSAQGGERWKTPPIPLARTAGYALIASGHDIHLLALSPSALSSPRSAFDLSASILGRRDESKVVFQAEPRSLGATSAFLHASKLVGAMKHVLRLTIDYSQARVQFGRPISKFQAIQHQLSVMAEHVAAAGIAVQLAAASGEVFPSRLAAGVAKDCASAAARTVAQTAHAVHGAIGISREHDLQLYTRRIEDWRVAEGGESYWAAEIGRHFFAQNKVRSADFVREHLGP